MNESYPSEQAIGIEYYVSETTGVGGRMRAQPDDFAVTEIEKFDTEPAGADAGAYPYLIIRAQLYNRETNEFVQALSSRLGISRKRIDWAGTKDKRAVSTQLFSIKAIDPEAITEIELGRSVEIDIVGRAGRALEFGDLAGNQFTITVSDPERPENAKEITDELETFGDETVGVPNYFGQQRFGSMRPITHEVGLSILREDWEDAVRTYVAEPAETEPEKTQQIRQTAGSHLAASELQQALDVLPNRLDYERTLVHALIEGKSHKEAIETLPWNLQRLFVHAVQSYIFNQILSRRLEEGISFVEPVPGDVVCFADRSAPEGVVIPDMDRTQTVSEARVETVSRHCKRQRAFITAPLVGTETDLGSGKIGEIERDVLEAFDIDTRSFALPDDWASEGTRRAIFLPVEPEITQDPLQFSFALPKGSYATVVMREYLKTPPVELG